MAVYTEPPRPHDLECGSTSTSRYVEKQKIIRYIEGSSRPMRNRGIAVALKETGADSPCRWNLIGRSFQAEGRARV